MALRVSRILRALTFGLFGKKEERISAPSADFPADENDEENNGGAEGNPTASDNRDQRDKRTQKENTEGKAPAERSQAPVMQGAKDALRLQEQEIVRTLANDVSRQPAQNPAKEASLAPGEPEKTPPAQERDAPSVSQPEKTAPEPTQAQTNAKEQANPKEQPKEQAQANAKEQANPKERKAEQNKPKEQSAQQAKPSSPPKAPKPAKAPKAKAPPPPKAPKPAKAPKAKASRGGSARNAAPETVASAAWSGPAQELEEEREKGKDTSIGAEAAKIEPLKAVQAEKASALSAAREAAPSMKESEPQAQAAQNDKKPEPDKAKDAQGEKRNEQENAAKRKSDGKTKIGGMRAKKGKSQSPAAEAAIAAGSRPITEALEGNASRLQPQQYASASADLSGQVNAPQVGGQKPAPGVSQGTGRT